MKKAHPPPICVTRDESADDPRQSDICALCTLLKPLEVCYTLRGLSWRTGLQLSATVRIRRLWIWNGAHSSRLVTTSTLDQALGSNVQLVQVSHGVRIFEHL